MTFAVADRILETSTTTGTGTLTLAGAETGYQALSVIGANNACTYFLTDGTNWEVGFGTYLATPSRLQRDTVLASSNAGAAVNWGGTTIEVRVGMPAAGIKAARRTSKSVAGSSNVTLTQSEMRCDILELTGVLTGNIDLIVDATPWAWEVYNNTSGSFSLTMKVSGQTGVVLTQGKRRHVYCDATDVRKGEDDAASDTLAGLIEIATQAEMETGADVVRAVPPGRQHFHQSACKGWAYCTFVGGVTAGYNSASVTDNGTGDMTVNWTTDMSSANYCGLATVQGDLGGSTANTLASHIASSGTDGAGTRARTARVSDGALTDGGNMYVAVWGDLA